MQDAPVRITRDAGSGKLNPLAAFRGKNVLVVEDGSFLRNDVRELLTEAGALVRGPTAMAEDLIYHLSGDIDGAVVDVDLPGDAALYVADVLEARGIPYVFATNVVTSLETTSFGGFALVANPVELDRIATALFGNELPSTLH